MSKLAPRPKHLPPGKVYREVLTEVTFHQYYFKGPTADRSGDQVRGRSLCILVYLSDR